MEKLVPRRPASCGWAAERVRAVSPTGPASPPPHPQGIVHMDLKSPNVLL